MTNYTIDSMRKIPAAKFKEQCLSILDRVDPDGIIITKHGRPVAQLLPIATAPATLIGCLKKKIKINGEIFSTGAKWDVES